MPTWRSLAANGLLVMVVTTLAGCGIPASGEDSVPDRPDRDERDQGLSGQPKGQTRNQVQASARIADEDVLPGLPPDHPAPVPELPPRLQDEREIERLKRERQKEEIRNEVEALRGLQTDELERKHDQLQRLKDMLQLDREVREGLRTSPELETIYQGIFQSGPGAPSCDCLDRVSLQLVSRAEVGVAVLSLDGLSRNYRQGESIGNTACRVGVVAEDDVTVQCGAGRCLLSLGRKECNAP